MRCRWSVGACLGAICCVTCGGGQRSGPTSPTPAPSSCRTYAHTISSSTTYEPYTIQRDEQTTCVFAPALVALICDTPHSDGTQTHVVAEYASVEQFVRETKVVPPLELAYRIRRDVMYPAQIARFTTTERTFDESGRLKTQSDRTGPPELRGGFTDYTFTAWDQQGRPIAATYLRGGVTPGDRTLEYDDLSRQKRVVDSDAGPGCSSSYDANGELIQQTCENLFGEVTRTTSTVTSVNQYCMP